eukprot:6218071-Pyramimonas_sp.AAC.1
MTLRCREASIGCCRQSCARCHRHKPRTVALVADAGQFFESVKPRTAIQAVRAVVSRCREATGKGVVRS